MLKRILLGSIIASMCAANVQAFDFKGTDTINVPLYRPHTMHNGESMAPSASARMNYKTIVLMKANLSASEKKAFTGFDPRTIKSTGNSSNLPATASIDMSNMSVLDQGLHGSCVTFATTGAINSLLGKDNFVSQLCSLELGSYLEKRSELPSGWDGSMGSLVLNQITAFGVVSMAKQNQGVCAGITAYPLKDAEQTGQPMSLDDFHAAKEDIQGMYWEPILSPFTRILNTIDHGYNGAKAESVFQSVKKAIATKLPGRQSRVTFGVLLPTSHCAKYAGACAKFNVANDTWALTDDINYDILMPQLDGHEMIITGYNDDAIVKEVDEEGNEIPGKTHKGIFILRNSWGSEVGDKGNYYMTYDFFKKFVFEAQQIIMTEAKESDNQQQ